MTHSRQYSWREGPLRLESVPLSMTPSQGWHPDSTPHLGSHSGWEHPAQQWKTQKEWGTRSNVHIEQWSTRGTWRKRSKCRVRPAKSELPAGHLGGDAQDAAEFHLLLWLPGNLGNTAQGEVICRAWKNWSGDSKTFQVYWGVSGSFYNFFLRKTWHDLVISPFASFPIWSLNLQSRHPWPREGT